MLFLSQCLGFNCPIPPTSVWLVTWLKFHEDSWSKTGSPCLETQKFLVTTEAFLLTAVFMIGESTSTGNWTSLYISMYSWLTENYKRDPSEDLASFPLLVLFKLVNEICEENMPSIPLRDYNEKRVNQEVISFNLRIVESSMRSRIFNISTVSHLYMCRQDKT